MDCFIIRVYRHSSDESGQSGEIAGLVERVGRKGNGRPFSSYQSLVGALRDEYLSTPAADKDISAKQDVHRLRLVRTGQPR